MTQQLSKDFLDEPTPETHEAPRQARSPAVASPSKSPGWPANRSRVATPARVTVTPRAAPRTQADVLAAVSAAKDRLTPSRHRDVRSAVRSYGRLCRLPLASLSADPREMRMRLDDIHPAAFNMSAKRLANIRADLARALEIADPSRRSGPPWPKLDPEWQSLRARCPSRWLKMQLHGFIRWCSLHGILPSGIDDATLETFVAHRDKRDLKLNVAKLRRQIARAWDQCVEAVPEWPQRPLSYVPARKRWTAPWSDFHPDFRQDADRWAARIAVVDLLDEEAPDRALKPISIKQSRFCVQMAATTLLSSGVLVGELRSLGDLVPPERVALVLNGLRPRYGRESATPCRVATTLKAVAEHYCKLGEKEVDRLRRLCRRVLFKRRGMSPKSRTRLLPFQDPATRDRFLLLPGELMRSAERDGRSPRQAARLARMAVALEIGQMAPMRAKNLAALEIGRHLTFVGHGRHEYAVISIPEEEVKNEIALEYPLSPESTRLIRRYMDRHLPNLGLGESRFLFPSPMGGPISTHTLSIQVQQVILRSIGHRVNIHLLRHFAAMIYLQAYPGAYEAVRRLLGHATASAALDFYVGFETAAAARHFDEVVLRQRRLAETRAKAQLRRGRRS